MNNLDASLARASEIFLGDLSDETDEELGHLLPQLAEAGYVSISGESHTAHLWAFTPEGIRRQEELGLL